MKKYRFILMAVLALVLSAGLSSCKDDDIIIVDYIPFEISIRITNPADET